MVYITPTKHRIVEKEVYESNTGKKYYSVKLIDNNYYIKLNVDEYIYNIIEEGFQYTLTLEHTTFYDSVNNKVLQRLKLIDVN